MLCTCFKVGYKNTKSYLIGIKLVVLQHPWSAGGSPATSTITDNNKVVI